MENSKIFDNINCDSLFRYTHSKLLLLIVMRDIDVHEIAVKEMESRGEFMSNFKDMLFKYEYENIDQKSWWNEHCEKFENNEKPFVLKVKADDWILEEIEGLKENELEIVVDRDFISVTGTEEIAFLTKPNPCKSKIESLKYIFSVLDNQDSFGCVHFIKNGFDWELIDGSKSVEDLGIGLIYY